MLDFDEARTRLLSAVTTLNHVTVPLQDSLGRCLAERVVADRDSPPTDRSAVDGYAVRAGDCPNETSSLVVSGEIRAGSDAAGIIVRAGEAVRIFTGGVLPEGADAVVMIETVVETLADGTVVVQGHPKTGQNIRRRAEERRRGDVIVEPGTIVRSVEIAALAAVGRTSISVVRRPRAVVIATGDEVVDPGAAPLAHQIRNSNGALLVAHLRSMGVDVTDLGIVPDNPGVLGDAIARGLDADVVILSGGVSVGAYDFVERALIDAGCKTLFHGVSMRPGKPILVAQRGRSLAFGLPGNPVSAFTCFRLFVVPALRRLMGFPVPLSPTVRATLEAPLRRRPGRLTFHLGDLRDREGTRVVAPVGSASSGDVLALVGANAFIVAPGDSEAIPAGRPVDVVPWD